MKLRLVMPTSPVFDDSWLQSGASDGQVLGPSMAPTEISRWLIQVAVVVHLKSMICLMQRQQTAVRLLV